VLRLLTFAVSLNATLRYATLRYTTLLLLLLLLLSRRVSLLESLRLTMGEGYEYTLTLALALLPVYGICAIVSGALRS
jgi:hypothetical protein